jgi:myosin heavy subunit
MSLSATADARKHSRRVSTTHETSPPPPSAAEQQQQLQPQPQSHAASSSSAATSASTAPASPATTLLPAAAATTPFAARPQAAGSAFFDRARTGTDDMITLTNLEAADRLQTLEVRFRKQIVYTYIGDIVVSVNPFRRTEYSAPHVQERYISLDPVRQMNELPPHIYAVVSQAYAEIRANPDCASLSILISGESGAGKTEAMKLCVSHLGAVSAASSAMDAGGDDSASVGNVASQLMATNPILEPLGNAKTVRNNNSSRFGKLFDIQLND